ncbi:MAG: hypothetical protein AUH11_00365 [Acidobacteria bacterium 13_2_20CM_57_17]|nr:MAG: hypothetical protein AUH11_00365 [Acidobacteria bacterium 13_2_20CM_57_17]
MTMVAGFCCTDGIVLCADSQETLDGYLKVDTPKAEIRPEGKSKRKGLFAVFVGAGHGPLIDALIEEMWDAAERARGGMKNASDAMKAANRKYHKELKEVFRDGDPEYPRAEIIYAAQF